MSKKQRYPLRYHIARLLRRYHILLVIPYYLHRFLQPKYTCGAVGIVVHDDRLLLVEHVFHPRYPWGLPGGWVGANEDPADAVQRELREELGLHVSRTELIHLKHTGRFHIDVAYLCHISDPTITALSYELLSYRWYPLGQLPPLLSFHRYAVEAWIHRHYAGGLLTDDPVTTAAL